MQQIIIDLVNSLGYFGIFFLIFIENVFPPIPSEIVLAFGGFMTRSSDMQPWFVVIFATFGSLLGAYVLYALGYFLGTERIKRVLDGKIGKVLHINSESVDKACKWFGKYENKAVFFCRFVPIVRSLISIPAGISKMNLVQFSLLTVVGSAIWNTVLVWLGVAGGDAWEKSVEYFGIYTNIALVILAVAAVAAFFIYRTKRKRNR